MRCTGRSTTTSHARKTTGGARRQTHTGHAGTRHAHTTPGDTATRTHRSDTRECPCIVTLRASRGMGVAGCDSIFLYARRQCAAAAADLGGVGRFGLEARRRGAATGVVPKHVPGSELRPVVLLLGRLWRSSLYLRNSGGPSVELRLHRLLVPQ